MLSCPPTLLELNLYIWVTIASVVLIEFQNIRPCLSYLTLVYHLQAGKHMLLGYSARHHIPPWLCYMVHIFISDTRWNIRKWVGTKKHYVLTTL